LLRDNGMGEWSADSATGEVMRKSTRGFEAGEATVKWPAACQKEFKIFSPKHSRYDAGGLETTQGSDPNERKRGRNGGNLHEGRRFL